MGRLDLVAAGRAEGRDDQRPLDFAQYPIVQAGGRQIALMGREIIVDVALDGRGKPLAAGHFDRVQSVDSEKLLELLDRAAAGLGRVLPVLLEINAGADPDKFGATPAAAPRLLETALAKKNLRVDGLMTIAPLSDDPAVARRAFAALRALRDQLAPKFSARLPVLSMGMSGDLAAAIAEGSTLVRIGTALFGARG